MKRSPEDIARLAAAAVAQARAACGDLLPLPASARYRVTRDAERIAATVADLTARRAGRWREAKAAWDRACRLWWELAQAGLCVLKGEIRRCAGLLPDEDLRQEAWIGLYEAARRFDPERGIKFTTHAKWWVRAILTRTVDKRAWELTISTTRSREAAVARKFARQAEAKGQHLTRRQLAELVGLSEDVLNDAIAATTRGSVSEFPNHDDAPMTELLPDVSWVPEDEIRVAEVTAKVDAAISGLDERAAAIVRARMAGGTLKESGAPHGLSRERARQIEMRSMDRLRRVLADLEAA